MDADAKRKAEEREFHDRLRDPDSTTIQSNSKFYSVTRSSVEYNDKKLREYSNGSVVLDYGCGNGKTSILMAKAGATVFGIDISGTSVNNSIAAAAEEGFSGSTNFQTMDGENMSFEDDTFDLIHIGGVLHHMDVRVAFPELSRVLKPGGKIVAAEALGHNPFIQLYRKMTPALRTAWEAKHIINKDDLRLASKYFDKVDYRFFHLAVLAAVPFRNMPGFNTMLTALDIVDRLLLSIPVLKWQAWQVIVELSGPVKALGIKAVDES